MIGLLIGMRRADGRIVLARPRTRMASMLQTRWRFDVSSFRCCGRLGGWRGTGSRDTVLWDTSCQEKEARDAMTTLIRRWNVPGIRKGANIGWWE
jgi:hypothetical protein